MVFSGIHELGMRLGYYAFGGIIPGRKFTAPNASKYRYGFNGKENDNEVKQDGNGNDLEGGQQDYGMRIYDPRLGRFLSVDPDADKYANITPYAYCENNPLFFVDPDGRNAVAKVSKNTITINAMIFIKNSGDIKIDVLQAQKSIMKYWGKNFTYKDENGKQYNVKFNISVKDLPVTQMEIPYDASSNIVYPQSKNYRSDVHGSGG